MGVCILGMGDCNTETSTDISNITNNDTNINNSIKNIINQDCNQQLSQGNTINIVGSNVKKLTAKQKNSFQSMCIMQSILKSNVSADVTNKLLDKIKSNVETTGAVLGSPASNKTVVKNMTTNKTNIDNSKFNEISKKCIVDLKQSNLLNIIGSNVEDTTTDQANEAFLKCLSQHSDDTGISAAALSDTKQESDNTSKTSGGDVGKSLGEAAKGIGEGVGTAGEGLGKGVGSGAAGIGAGASAFISSFTYPIIGGIVCLCIVCVISSFLMMYHPQAAQSAQQFAQTAANIHQMYRPAMSSGMPNMPNMPTGMY